MTVAIAFTLFQTRIELVRLPVNVDALDGAHSGFSAYAPTKLIPSFP